MKQLFLCIFATIITFPAFAQNDTVIVENIVKFYIYNDANYKNVDAIDFIMKVTNNTGNPLPDLGATNRSQNVNFYINGKVDNPLSLYNGAEYAYGDKTISPGSTDTFDSGGWILTDDSGIRKKYGNEFTVQWEYMKIKSDIIKVNLNDKTFKTIAK